MLNVLHPVSVAPLYLIRKTTKTFSGLCNVLIPILLYFMHRKGIHNYFSNFKAQMDVMAGAEEE